MEVKGLRLVALLCVLLVILAPTAAADGDGRPGQGGHGGPGQGHGGHGNGNHGDGNGGNGSRGDDNHGGRGGSNDDGQGNGNETNSLTLDGAINETTAELEWVFSGAEDNLAGFEIYRSVNEGAVELIATVDATVRTLNDSLPTGPAGSSGSYTYSARATMVDSTASQSNSVTMLLLTCQWISVSPFGNPPLLIHDECGPFPSA